MFPLESKNDDYMVKNMSIKVISMVRVEIIC